MSLLSDTDLRRALAFAERWKVEEQARFDRNQTLTEDRLCELEHPTRFPAHGIDVEPFDPASIQPASIDLCLGGQFRYWQHPAEAPAKAWGMQPDWDDGRHFPVIDPMAPEAGGVVMLTASLDRLGDTFDVAPGQFILAHTLETVTVGACLAVQVYGKSSIGRLGLEVENAGYVDPGFSGQVTLELKNSTAFPIRLTVGMPICQIVAHRLTSPAALPYGAPERDSRYQGQLGATPSRYGSGRAPIGKPSIRQAVASRELTKALVEEGNERWPETLRRHLGGI